MAYDIISTQHRAAFHYTSVAEKKDNHEDISILDGSGQTYKHTNAIVLSSG